MILGLDCSGETYSVGLFSSTGISLETSGHQPRRALQQLPTAIKEVLERAGTRVGDLEAMGVTHGPGSFTGVRLGVTVAKTVAMVAGCPVMGWDTLELLAHQALPEGSLGTVAVALDARRSELYCGLFEATPTMQVRLATDVRAPRDFAQHIPDTLHAAIGSGFEAYPQLLRPDWGGPRWTSRQASAPGGLLVARLTAAHRDHWKPATELVPVYHRRADIQVQGGG